MEWLEEISNILSKNLWLQYVKNKETPECIFK